MVPMVPFMTCLEYFINQEHTPQPLPGPHGRRARVLNALVVEGNLRLPDISLLHNYFEMSNFLRLGQHLYAIGFVKSPVEASWAHMNKSGSVQDTIDSCIY